MRDGPSVRGDAMIQVSDVSKIYGGRPAVNGVTFTVSKAEDLFADRFMNVQKYTLGKVGRFRMNRKFGLPDRTGMDSPDEGLLLTAEDLCRCIQYSRNARRRGSTSRSFTRLAATLLAITSSR